MKKLLCLLLVIMIVMTAIIACGPANDPDDTKGNGNDTSAPQNEGYDPELTALENALRQYGNLNALKGEEFVILSPNPGSHFYHYSGANENEIWYEGPSSEPLPQAIYQRNRKVEEALGITITPMWGESPDNINTIVSLSDASGDDDFNVILNRLDYEVSYAQNGYLYNFYEIDSMNMKNRWWDEQIVDTFTIYGNKLYVLSGDINYYDDYAVQIVLFNKDMCDTIKREYPYQAVRDGKWTIDMMTEMADLAKHDVNGDDVFTPGSDTLGLGDNYDCVSHFLYCYGQTMSTLNTDGEPEVVWASDANVRIIEKIYDIFTADYASTDTGGNATHFSNNKLLFYCEMLGVLPTFRDMQSDFGILPMPKGSESMDRYNAYVSNGWSTAFAIPKTFSREAAYNTGIILECMSAASKDYITPALYDQLLESKYIRDEDSKEMLSYILDSKVYDLAGDLSWATALRSTYQNVLSKGPSSFATSLEAGRKSIEKSLSKFCESIRELNTDAVTPPDNTGTDAPGDTTAAQTAVYALGAKIEAEDFDEKNGSVQAEMIADGSIGMNLGYVATGDWVQYIGVELTGAVSFTGRMAGSSGRIEIRIDAPDGELLATSDVVNTGSWSAYDEFTFDLESTADGIHDVYIVFIDASSNLDWFVFNGK